MFDDIPNILAQDAMKPVAAPTGDAVEVQPSGPNGGVPAGADGAAGQSDGFPPMLIMLVIALPVMFLLMGGGQRKEKKRRKEMMENLSKGDKVQTIGGIMGTVIEVRDNEVIVKIDENNNTRMKFTRAAIQSIIEDEKQS